MRRIMRRIVLALTLASAASGALAQGQPPIQGPEDAACREEAKNRLLGAPNPQGLSPFDLGARLYHECMRRLGAEGSDTKPRT